ncbi:MAG: glycosyltransferase family 39 protein [Nakamurella sp.]
MAAAPWALRRRLRPVAVRSFGAVSILVVAAMPVLAYLVVAVLRIGYPYELSHFEGSMVEVTARVATGQPLYARPTLEFTPWPYPPLYFWLTGAVASVTGVSLLPLRLVSLVASLIVLLLIAVIIRRAGGSGLAAAVGVGLYAASYRVSGAWADTARVDSVLLAFLLSAVAVGVRAGTAAGGAAVGGLLFLAFLTKQTAVLVAMPIVCWLLVFRRPAGLTAAIVLIGGIAGSTLLGDLLTGGWYSPAVVRQLLGQPWAPRWLWEFWLVDLLLPFGLAIGLGVWLVRRFRPVEFRWATVRQWRRPTEVSFLAAAGVGLLIAALAGRIHEGGYVNVSMPAHAGLAIGVAMIFAGALRTGRLGGRLLVAVAAILLLQFGAMTLWRLHVVPSAADRAAGDQLIADLRALPGTVVMPGHPYYLRLAGKPVTASSIAIFDVLASREGRGRDAVTALLPWSLDGVSAVVLDDSSQAGLFGAALARDFTLASSAFVPDGTLVQVTDQPRRPTLLYLRTTPAPGPS